MRLLCGLLLLPALGWGWALPARASVDTRLAEQGFASAPLYRLPESTIDMVDATIDGHRFRLVVDSGAPHTVLFRAAVEKAGIALAPLEGGSAWGINGKADAAPALAQVKHFALGGTELPSPPPILVSTFRPTVINDGTKCDGLLGLDFLRRYAAVFGVTSARLFFHADGFPARGLDPFIRSYGFVALTPRLVQGHYFIPVRIDGKEATLLVDSGASATLLDRDFATRAGLALAAGLGWGVGIDGHQVAQGRARFRTLDVGGAVLSAGTVGIGRVTLFRAFGDQTCEGLLGCEVLRRLRAFIDAGNDCLYLDTVADRK